MGTRSVVACLGLSLALAACSERQAPESVAGPSLAGNPTDPAACDPNSLNSLLAAYFPGNSGSAAKTAKDAMIAATVGSNERLNQGFVVLQEIGNLSREQAVDTVAGSNLAQGTIKCMYNTTTFTPSFPSDPIYNFAPALAADHGGAFYTRGGGTGDEAPVHGAAGVITGTPDILSGVNPLTGTWATVLAGSPAGKALIYGYQVTSNPFVYEWATIPPATQFAGSAVVALCDGSNASTAMVHESNIGVLAYQSASPICDATYSLVMKETGWGPRALAARLAHVVIDALQPQPLQAVALKSGTGGTATTFKSKLSKQPVSTQGVTLTGLQVPPALIKGTSPGFTFPVKYQVSASGKALFGTCVFMLGANNNGAPTALTGPRTSACPPPAGVDPTAVLSVETTSANDPTFTIADFGQTGVTKNGGIVFTVFADVKDRDGGSASLIYKSNVKPPK
jgi:hypothetical protein